MWGDGGGGGGLFLGPLSGIQARYIQKGRMHIRGQYVSKFYLRIYNPQILTLEISIGNEK